MMPDGNDCAHTHGTNHREGDDMVLRCDNCGHEMARTKNAY
jgi:hypothetical protein